MRFDGPSTPKALANASPGLLQPWVRSYTKVLNSEGVQCKPNTFSVFLFLRLSPGLKQPWARISQRLRRIAKSSSNCHHDAPLAPHPNLVCSNAASIAEARVDAAVVESPCRPYPA